MGELHSESKGLKQDGAPTKLATFGFSAGATSVVSDPHHLAEKSLHTNKLGSTALDDSCLSASSAKRKFSDVGRSPVPLEIQAKKSNAIYERCYEIPEETMRFHTGLTGTFSTIQIGDFMVSTERIGSTEDQIPKRSSPIAVAKILFSELEDLTEDVFEDEAKDLSRSSFTSPLAGNGDICRSLSLDSDGSMHETSLTIDSRASLKPSECSINRNLASPEQQKENKDVSITESLPQTPSAVNTGTPKLGHFSRGGSQCSFLNPLPDLAQSSSFLKPRNVVAFRSYCSSINRSNTSGMSRFSVGSVEAMDMSTAASYHSASGNATPVQKRPSSNSSLYQVRI